LLLSDGDCLAQPGNPHLVWQFCHMKPEEMAMEIEFTLPHGFVDQSGRVHRFGRMRMATVMDEIAPALQATQQYNDAYMVVLLMARVITQLGELQQITPEIVGALYAADMIYLEDLYLRLNSSEQIVMGTTCPHCQSQFNIAVAPLGGVTA
jgi:hypothetical protein